MKTQISLLALTITLSTITALGQETPPPSEKGPSHAEEWNADQPEARHQRRLRERAADQDAFEPQQRRRRAMMDNEERPLPPGPGRQFREGQMDRPDVDGPPPFARRRMQQAAPAEESAAPGPRMRGRAMLQNQQGPQREGMPPRDFRSAPRQRPGFSGPNDRPGRGFQPRQQNPEQDITCPNCGVHFNPRQGPHQGPRGQNMDRPGNNPNRGQNAWNQPSERPQGPRGERPRGPRWNSENDRPNDFAPMDRGPRPGFGPPQGR